MFLKASALSFALLLLSRLLGLVRESAQAAAFGTSGMADVAVLMLTLPDWLTGVLVSGALAYVLLPAWATQSAYARAYSQARAARYVLGLGIVGSALLVTFQDTAVHLFASGLPPALAAQARLGLVWSAGALPAALLAALWYTRLQHERDFVGLYASNLVVNATLVVAYWCTAVFAPFGSIVSLLGLFLGLAMGLRLVFLHGRMARYASPAPDHAPLTTSPLPPVRVWLWAALSAGLPIALPFAARSYASAGGEGALATFNYAWKLVELPLVLAIQLVATLAFPAITRAMAEHSPQSSPADHGTPPPQAVRAIRAAFLLGWTVACAAVAALQVGAPAIVGLLFGWGRMPADSLSRVALWGGIGAWSLLPQALIAVALTVLATQNRMRTAVAAYLLALLGLLGWGAWSHGDGVDLMVAIDAVLCMVATITVLELRQTGQNRTYALNLLPWRAMAVPASALALCAVANAQWGFTQPASHGIYPLAYCILAALGVVAVSYGANAELRSALRR